MLKLSLIPLIVLASSTAVNAQEVLDKSDRKLPATLVSEALPAVAHELRDPESAQFRELSFFSTKQTNSQSGTEVEREGICGEVNGKNGYGGYAGFAAFRYFSKPAKVYLGIGCP